MNILLYINIVLFLLGILILLYKRAYTIYYFLLWKICGAYITDIFIYTVPYTEFEIFGKYSNIYIYLTFIFITITKKNKIVSLKDTKLLICFFSFLLYTYILSIFRNTTNNFWIEFIILNFTWIPFYYTTRYVPINKQVAYRFTTNLLILQIILFILQNYGIGCSTFSEVRENFFYSPPGTYYRYNYFATGVSIIIIFLLLYNQLINKINKYIYPLIMIGIYLVFISGSRTSLIALGVSIILIYIKKYYNVVKLIFPFIIILLPTLIAWITQQEANKDFGADVMTRQANILAIFSGDNTYLLEESTFGLTVILIIYFIQNISILSFLFGYGEMFTRKISYGYINTENMTDATLMVYIGETGIIGLIFLIVTIKLLLNNVYQNRYYFYILVLFLILNTITDRGIFYSHDTAFFIILLSLYKQKQNETINNYPCL